MEHESGEIAQGQKFWGRGRRPANLPSHRQRVDLIKKPEQFAEVIVKVIVTQAH